MSEKYLIVGATGSIGSSLAEQLYASEKEIHLVGRNVEETKSLSEKFNCSYTIADATKMPLAGGNFTGAVVHNYTTAMGLPVGTTAQRPASPNTGDFRFNTTTSEAEIYDGSSFTSVGGGGGGGTGGGGEQIFFESENQMDNSYTISSNHNALVAGPLTIASGATLTINSPSVVTIP